MNVLSLFDGMSCARIALDRSVINVDNYYASEIDKYAIAVSKANYPDIVQLGDIKSHNDWELPKIDLLIAGFPCQAWSVAGKQKGDNDPRGELVHDLIEVWEKYNPKYFLFENVRMKKEFMEYISYLFGVEPILINSALVSAQNRNRYYWTNIQGIEQPEDKGVLLKDIIESDVVDRDKSHCIDANYFKGGNLKSYFEKNRRQLVFSKDGLCHGASMIGRKINPDTGRRDDYNKNLTIKQYIEANENTDKSRCLSTVQKDTLLSNKKSGRHLPENLKYRKLTPIECERLQTVPDNYTNHVSNTQRYKMLGNGFTVDVIAHILRCIK